MRTWVMTMPKDHPTMTLADLLRHAEWGLPVGPTVVEMLISTKSGMQRPYVRGDRLTLDHGGTRYEWVPSFDPLRDA